MTALCYFGRFRLGRRITFDSYDRKAAFLKAHHCLQDDGFLLAFDVSREGICLVEDSGLDLPLEMGAGRASDPRNQRGE